MSQEEWFNTLGRYYLPREYRMPFVSGGILDADSFLKEYERKFLSEQEWDMMNAKIVDVREIVKNKVVEVTFADGDKQKAICQEPDVFSLEMAISICITKHLLGGTKEYNKAVRDGVKRYEDKIKNKKKVIEEAERFEKRKAKLAAYKKRKAERRKEAQIEMQKEAYLRALRDFNKELSETSCE